MNAILADLLLAVVISGLTWLMTGGAYATPAPVRGHNNERCGECGEEATSTHRCPGRPRTAPSWALRTILPPDECPDCHGPAHPGQPCPGGGQ